MSLNLRYQLVLENVMIMFEFSNITENSCIMNKPNHNKNKLSIAVRTED